VSPTNLAQIYEKTNYAFLFAPNFHKGMKYIAPVRKEMPNPTIFNLLGPLTNPVEQALEARMIGVKKADLVPVFAEALKLNGARKALVVCGAEDLDEISIAGKTHCARLREFQHGPTDVEGHRPVEIEYFTLEPKDFGIPAHPLSTVSPGLTPEENASILERLLTNQLPQDDPILHFCLINTAALFVVAGVCDEDEEETIKEVGPGGGRWKDGVRLARRAISSGKAMEMIRGFAEATNALAA
jgi:anthranilate phosphoribosyltransferase